MSRIFFFLVCFSDFLPKKIEEDKHGAVMSYIEWLRCTASCMSGLCFIINYFLVTFFVFFLHKIITFSFYCDYNNFFLAATTALALARVVL